MTSNNLAQWSRFWEQGFITTFGASKPQNYDGVVRAFWREKFMALPDGARVLDIATGNGAIATLAAETARDYGKHFEIEATDLAEISDSIVDNSEAAALRGSIRFHSRIPCDEQPFDDDTVDFACSQFGFEYSDAEATLQEMRRVLVPGGQFVAISHHSDSALIVAAREELGIYAAALDEIDLFGRLGSYFEALGDIGDTDESLARALQRAQPHARPMNAGVNEFTRRYGRNECAQDIVGAVNSLARGAGRATMAQRRAAIAAATEDFTLARERLRDMEDAALNPAEADTLRETARDIGFASAFCLALYADDGALAGWQIHLK